MKKPKDFALKFEALHRAWTNIYACELEEFKKTDGAAAWKRPEMKRIANIREICFRLYQNAYRMGL